MLINSRQVNDWTTELTLSSIGGSVTITVTRNSVTLKAKGEVQLLDPADLTLMRDRAYQAQIALMGE
jgi:hypothetical protein